MEKTRPATLKDLAVITEIYNEAILNSTATFDTEPKSIQEQADWLAEHGGKYPVMVAELEDIVVGWASLSRWSDRCAYSDTAEISVYVFERYRGMGIGRGLMVSILDEGKKVGLHAVVARITEEGAISVHLHESLGFEHIGTMKEVGKKFGKLLDVHLMQRNY